MEKPAGGHGTCWMPGGEAVMLRVSPSPEE